MNKDEALKDLCRALVADPEVTALPDWQKVVMVGIVEGDSARMHGYCFDAGGDWEAAAPRQRGTLELLRALRSSMQESDPAARAWVSCLLRFSSDGQVGVDFEYDDASRWAVSPANRKARVSEFAAMPVRGA
jgi:hypothetical protein